MYITRRSSSYMDSREASIRSIFQFYNLESFVDDELAAWSDKCHQPKPKKKEQEKPPSEAEILQFLTEVVCVDIAEEGMETDAPDHDSNGQPKETTLQ